MSVRQRRAVGDDGVATVWAAGACAVLVLIFVALLWLASATITRHRAAAAADLAALAAAAHLRYGPESACERAALVAERMRAAIDSCEFRGADALVVLTLEPPRALLVTGVAKGRARAGPVDPATMSGSAR